MIQQSYIIKYHLNNDKISVFTFTCLLNYVVVCTYRLYYFITTGTFINHNVYCAVDNKLTNWLYIYI